MSQPKTGICALCGIEGKITRDHLPPRACFPHPKPTDPITVPACASCNGGRSDLDDKFALFLGIAVHGQSPEGKALWGERAKRINENKRFAREIEEAKTETDQGFRFTLDFSQFHSIFDAIFRGLYFRQFKSVYPPNRKFEMIFRSKLLPADQELALRLFKGSVGSDQFLHGICCCDEDESVAAGLLIFYDKFAIIGIGGLPRKSKGESGRDRD